jgi:outer membrane protein assembly factor BamB
MAAGSAHGAPPPAAPAAAEQAIARQILDAAGVKGGLIVHLGCGDGKLTAALRAGDAFVVHGLDADAANVEKAREHIRSLGLYGPVSAEQWAGKRLPHIDNLVNLLVITDAGLQIPEDEALRVLAPEGVLCVKAGAEWKKTVKPRPKNIDEWTHYLHAADNNAVAHDEVVGPPRHLQWTGDPLWARHHDHMASMTALVSANGRIFYIMDEGPRDAILLPSRWMLVARDAFNGKILWKRAIPEWNTQLWPLKSGPNQLPRRLVAVGNRVYVTLGIDAALTALDAATGQTIRTYEGTQFTDEILFSDGMLFLLVAQSPNKWKEYRPKNTFVWDNPTRANRDWAWDQANRWVMAIEADSGAVAWKKERRVAPLTLAAGRDRIFFHDGDKAVALSRKTGDEAWASEPIQRKTPLPTGYGPTLVVQQDVVLVSVEQASMTALSAADGKKLWESAHHRGGHASPDDMLVIGGLVWSGAVAAGQDSGIFTGRDIRTGEVKSEFPPDINAYWFHHRCYRSKATDRFIMTSRTGIEFIDPAARHWDINHWVRGGCLYGIMPANGMIYVPPQACGCYLESKLFAFNALAAASPGRAVPREVPEAGRLERGPAYAEAVAEAPPAPEDWPTYRHDGMRSGAVATSVPAEPKRVWEMSLGGRLGGVTAVGDKVFVAASSAHAVYALDAGSGKVAWSFTAGARVDSPPTVYQGRVIFGSADGWVYCLRAADGRLIWRYRAAPEERRVMAFEQLESPWPVSGSVLVHNGAVYCVAGRSAFLDGGMRLVRLDAKTGRSLSETLLDDRDPETGGNLQMQMKNLDMPVALPDVLSCDGQRIYMRAQPFDLEGKRLGVAPIKDDPAGEGVHLFSRTGFLDDSWYFRSYWIFGRSVDSGYGSWFKPGHLAPAGRLLVFDEECIYGFDRKPEFLCNASVQEYYLYAADKQVRGDAVARVQAAVKRIDAASPKKGASSSDWAARRNFPMTDQSVASYKWAAGTPPIRARAMVLAGKTLFVAGPPSVVDELAALANPDDPAVRARLEEQSAALDGRKGSQLLAFSAADGKSLGACELGAMPTFDGMAAARGRLFMTTTDGRVLCLGDAGAALPAAPPAKLAPLDTSIKAPPPAPPEPPAAAETKEPPAKKDFASVSQARVTKSELGYCLRAEGKKIGLALRQLPAPLKGKVEFALSLKSRPDGALKNGFLVFGDGPDEAALVHCGLRFALNKAVIVEGPLSGAAAAEQQLELDIATVHKIEVTVDLDSGAVTMKTGGAAVTAALKRRPAGISHVGYGVLGAATDFSTIEISGK